MNGEIGAAWVEKVLQLYQITNLNHGLMLVGPSGSGKTTAWKVLLTVGLSVCRSRACKVQVHLCNLGVGTVGESGRCGPRHRRESYVERCAVRMDGPEYS